MKAIEFDKIDNTYLIIEQKTMKVCKENDVNFYNYLGVFLMLLTNYRKEKKLIDVIKSLNFEDKISTRAILNKAHFSSKEQELLAANENFNKSKIILYNWLDNTKNPYFFILNPVYKYGAGYDYTSYSTKNFGYIKEKATGSQNLDIAYDYANYLIK